MQLLVINYAMDDDNALLSHQVEAVSGLALHFEHVWVVTSWTGKYKVPPNVTVIDNKWSKGKILSNVFRTFKSILPLLLKKNLVVFSHMTDVQCALISPFTKVLRRKHFLWYAHKSNSIYLKWCSFWVSGILTSTIGSCPIKGKSVTAIGQAIDLERFRSKERRDRRYDKWVHVGRFDPSKNIGEIVRVFRNLEHTHPNLTFEQVGKPSTNLAQFYADEILIQNQTYIIRGKMIFSESIPRREVATKLNQFDVFVHCYLGSLDKSILEATACGIPVVTTNPEYIKEFGSWSGSLNASLEEEFYALSNLHPDLVEQELHRRIEYIRANHSFNSWVARVAIILQTM